MKKIGLVALAAATVLAFAGCKQEEKFVLGLDASFPPMGFAAADGTITGYDIDLAQEVCRRLNIPFEAKPIDWKAKEMELSTGSIDCIWSGFTSTPERQEAMYLSKPYLNNDQVLVVRKDSGIASIDDAKGKIIGVQKDSSAEDAINANKDFADSVKETTKYFADNLIALTDLETGGVDAVVMDSVVADYQIQQKKAQNVDTLMVVPGSLAQETYVIGFRKDDYGKDLCEKVWATLEEMAKDGTIEKISTKWFGADISVIGK